MWKVVLGCLVWVTVQGWDIDITLNVDTIIELDGAMVEDVNTPNKIKKNVIMNNMLKLFLTLDQIYEKLQEGGDDALKMRRLMEEVKCKGGLKVLNLKQEDEKLMKTYDWDEDRATQLRRNLERACEMWRNIWEVLDTSTTPSNGS